MKKTWIWGLCLILVGALLFSLGFFGSGMNLSAMNGTLGPLEVRVGNRRGFGGSQDASASGSAAGAYLERSEAYDARDIRRIVLEEDNADLTVTASPDGRVHLRWQESGDDPMEITNDGGTLSVRRKPRVGIFFFWDFWDEDLHTELQIPAGMTVTLDVESDNGSVTAEGLRLDGGAEFSSDNGALTVTGLSVGDLTLKSSNGAIRAEDVVCGAASVKNSNGKIEVEDFSCASLEAVGSNGAVTLTKVSAETTLYAKTSNSRISVSGVSAGERIELRSSNGRVSGTLAGSSGDYTIESKTSNGSNNLPASWGRGPVQLTVRTDNGAIDLRFAED